MCREHITCRFPRSITLSRGLTETTYKIVCIRARKFMQLSYDNELRSGNLKHVVAYARHMSLLQRRIEKFINGREKNYFI